jgi:hypothetical protein
MASAGVLQLKKKRNFLDDRAFEDPLASNLAPTIIFHLRITETLDKDPQWGLDRRNRSRKRT